MLLIDQLDLLSATMDRIFDAVVRVDADALIAHGRFLQDKFGHAPAPPLRPDPPTSRRPVRAAVWTCREERTDWARNALKALDDALNKVTRDREAAPTASATPTRARRRTARPLPAGSHRTRTIPRHRQRQTTRGPMADIGHSVNFRPD